VLWSRCRGASELANLIDAVPCHLRPPILRAALSFTPSDDFEASHLVGVYRSQLFDCLFEFSGLRLDAKVGQLQENALENNLRKFAEAGDPAQVQLAVCDLLEFIATSVGKLGYAR
jgi:hypothetical protein